MQGIREYLLSITGAAIICAIAKHMVGQKGSAEKIIHIISGLFLAVTMVSPVLNLRIGSVENFFDGIHFDAEAFAAEGSQMANDALNDIIKEQIRAYILDEATRLGTQMDVEVKLSDSNPPELSQVIIKGSVLPYQKNRISVYLSEYFGISQEQQIWK